MSDPEYFRGHTRGTEFGKELEHERILNLIKSFYCGEPGCTKHSADMAKLIELIKGDK